MATDVILQVSQRISQRAGAAYKNKAKSHTVNEAIMSGTLSLGYFHGGHSLGGPHCRSGEAANCCSEHCW